MLASPVSVFSTCPESRAAGPAAYARLVAEVSRWSEEVGCEGMLIYTENGLVDPWLTAQLAVLATDRLEPLIAVQPVYMHPYTVAKLVATFAYLHGRRTQLNLVAGGFTNDLRALGHELEHDARYARLLDYGQIVMGLVAGAPPITRTTGSYRVRELRLQPAVPAELQPRLMLSGSSEAGIATARALGATAVRYPRPAEEEEPLAAATDIRQGIRLGIIVRDDAGEAWRVARERFPDDRAGQITHRLAMSASDSRWHRQLSRLALDTEARERPYWLRPFQNYSTFCPYLVGDQETVAGELAAYLRRGVDTVILDIPQSREDLELSMSVIDAAAGAVT